MPDLLSTDTLTVPLGIVCAIAFLLHSYLTPQSLVHPILLGRQADVERIRKPGESAIYRSYATGMMGQLPVRPAAAVRTQLDLIKPELENSRSLWSSKVTNAELLERVKALASGLVREAGLTPKESNVLLLLNDSLEFIVADFALASISVPSFTLSSPTILSSLLETHPPDAIILHSFFVPRVLELLADNNELRNHKLIVVGVDSLPRDLQNLGVQVFSFSALEKRGKDAGLKDFPTPDPNDVYSVFFYEEQGERKATQLTHENATAGVVATRVLLPLNGPFSPADSLLSSHCLSTPLGRVVAYTAIFEGSNFTTTKSTILYRKEDEISSKVSEFDDLGSLSPLPTVIFLSGEELQAITSSILANAKKSIFMPLAWRHKIFALQQGNLSKETLWDRISFSEARKSVLGKADEVIRAFIVSGCVDSSTLTPARIALSLPLVNAHAHPLVAGPVFVSHPSDLQIFPAAPSQKDSELAKLAHVGPPSINIEIKLTGVHDEAVEGGSDPAGEVYVRGPTVTRPLDENNDPEGWIRTGDRAAVQPNGTFKVLRKA